MAGGCSKSRVCEVPETTADLCIFHYRPKTTSNELESMPSEKETRASLIDRKLQLGSWAADDPMQVVREFRIESPSALPACEPAAGQGDLQFSDYVLLDKNGQPLAVVAAKKTSVDAAIGRDREGTSGAAGDDRMRKFCQMDSKPIEFDGFKTQTGLNLRFATATTMRSATADLKLPVCEGNA